MMIRIKTTFCKSILCLEFSWILIVVCIIGLSIYLYIYLSTYLILLIITKKFIHRLSFRWNARTLLDTWLSTGFVSLSPFSSFSCLFLWSELGTQETHELQFKMDFGESSSSSFLVELLEPFSSLMEALGPFGCTLAWLVASCLF